MQQTQDVIWPEAHSSGATTGIWTQVHAAPKFKLAAAQDSL